MTEQTNDQLELVTWNLVYLDERLRPGSKSFGLERPVYAERKFLAYPRRRLKYQGHKKHA